jgi:hypothetical protein
MVITNFIGVKIIFQSLNLSIFDKQIENTFFYFKILNLNYQFIGLIQLASIDFILWILNVIAFEYLNKLRTCSIAYQCPLSPA